MDIFFQILIEDSDENNENVEVDSSVYHSEETGQAEAISNVPVIAQQKLFSMEQQWELELMFDQLKRRLLFSFL